MINNETEVVSTSEVTEETDEEEYIDGYKVVSFDNLVEKDYMQNICVIGMVTNPNNFGMHITDKDGNSWYVEGTGVRDLTEYEGTECKVCGGCFGGISSRFNTPLINMTRDEDHIIFEDGKILYPENYESCQEFPAWQFDNESASVGSVWIPTDGGTKYHSISSCSGMDNPEQVTESEAIDRGYSKCGKCW